MESKVYVEEGLDGSKVVRFEDYGIREEIPVPSSRELIIRFVFNLTLKIYENY